ncbi:Nn.00g012710.m01.CDS01 [Neocucurbitaria sp. VM-36]
MAFRAPRHDSYGFHITLAYFLRHMDEKDSAELDRMVLENLEALNREFILGAVEFCTFENMQSFSRLFFLEKPQEGSL